MDYNAIRGFNYQPSYGSTGLEIWLRFDAATMDAELARGKRYFPGMNAIRLWLSRDAFQRDPQRFAFNFEAALAVAQRHNLAVMPVLFNRWHSDSLDYGGVYIDHFLPGVSWVQRGAGLGPFMEAVVGAHAADPRIFCWDLCNEPFSYLSPQAEIPDIVKAELAWLTDLYKRCKDLGAKAPITIGLHCNHGVDGLAQVESISDVLSIHPYFGCGPNREEAAFAASLDAYASYAKKIGKPILATETCWGYQNDQERVGIIRTTLKHLKQRGFGYLVYLLNHSLIADAHRPAYGPGNLNLSFIEADGSLRPGHECFNEF
jgi:endo-1,4-beta-mannosidase